MTRARFVELMTKYQRAVEEAKRLEMCAETYRQEAYRIHSELLDQLSFEKE